ncbi:MAG: hypothetical protein R2794_08310 [Chitinophagales bacterium]
MQKIKFNISYKPLSDAQIGKHQNFDALLAAYTAAPKPNSIQQFIHNKWIMFTGGIIIGSMITGLIMLHQGNERMERIAIQQPDTLVTENTQVTDGENAMQGQTVQQKDIIETYSNATKAEPLVEKSSTSDPLPSLPSHDRQTDITVAAERNALQLNAAMKNNIALVADQQPAEKKLDVDEFDLQDKGQSSDPSMQKDGVNSEVSGIAAEQTDDKHVADPASAEINAKEAQQIADNMQEKEKDDAVKKKAEKNKAVEGKKENKVPEPVAEKETKNDTTSIAFIDRIIQKQQSKDTSAAKNAFLSDTTYIDRYAQLSFFSPLGTNGIESYKYKHQVSFNIIQGLNGAVEGAEFGGVINLDRGYVHGVQCAGVLNMIGGDLKGFQGAGVLNVSRNVDGFQGAGVLNCAVGDVRGFQGAGVLNLAVRNTQGVQLAGVLNAVTGHDSMQLFQGAGVVNFANGKSNGAQVAGVLNVAIDKKGTQVGLVNIADNMTGLQIGLINIADTLDGVAIGLLSFSRNGIFDVDLFTSDVFTFNAGIRIGGPSVYNVFSFGTAPFADTASYGYGLGIGGHIPVHSFFVDMDVMSWNMHKDAFEFKYDQLHMDNQLRVLPGYTINKYISVFAGPVLHVEVFDNDIVPLHDRPIAQYTGQNVSTSISLGYTAGIRFF